MLKKISSVTKTLQKMHLFFFRELRLITVLLLIHKSYTGWSTSFISVKQWYFPFSIPPCFFLSLYFCSAKRRGSLTLKCYNSFKNKNNRKKHTVLLLNYWFLSCNKNFENSLISAWVGVSKIWPGNELLKLRKSKF